MSVAISWANKMQLAKCDIMVGFPISSHIFSFMPENSYSKCERNVLEMSCVLVTVNVPEISCILVQEMCLKFCPILHYGNIKISWYRKCSCH